MKNLFDYATKELSQDAFLRWFIENDYNGSGRELLGVLTNVNPSEISNIRTWAQFEHIDIWVEFDVGSEPHILIIEDKVNTGDHSNQLVRYMKSVKKWNNSSEKYKNRKSHFVFYKTRILNEADKEHIISQSIGDEKYSWIVFDLLKINSFFLKYIKSDNLVIQQYAEYINGRSYDSTNVVIPKEHRIIAWKSFFERTVKPYFDNTDLDVYVGETFYGYSYLTFRPKGSVKSKTPYLEIRSRDCLNNHMVGRILLYGVDLSNEEKSAIKEKISTFGKMFKKENNSQQIASTNKRKQEPIKYESQEDFINKVIEMANEYLSIVW